MLLFVSEQFPNSQIFVLNTNQDLWEIFNKVWKDIAIKDSITSVNSSHFLFYGIFLQLLNFSVWIFLQCFKVGLQETMIQFKHDMFYRIHTEYKWVFSEISFSSFSFLYEKFYFLKVYHFLSSKCLISFLFNFVK